MLEELNLDGIQDENARHCIKKLLNIIENLVSENRALREENRRLRDEVNRLKGEQGKPDIKSNTKENPPRDISSEKERKRPEKWKKGSKKGKIQINRTEVCKVDKNILPKDALFKGYEEATVQDLRISPDNTLFQKEKYYSPSERKTYIANLPEGYEGEFGPYVKSLIIVWHYGSNMTELKIEEFLENFGIYISKGQISNILIKGKDDFHKEKSEVYKAGINNSDYQQIDDTGMRVKGKNYYCHIICNPLYTAYFTTEKKDRLTILDVLQNFGKRRYIINEEAISLLANFNLSQNVFRKINLFPLEKELTEVEFIELLDEHLPQLGKLQRTRFFESCAIAYYHRQIEFPIVNLLVCDNAPQFKVLTKELALCWIHEGRHYKKLMPEVKNHRQLLDDFLGEFWQFYGKLLDYKEEPGEDMSLALSKEFDKLFSSVTDYDALDDRIAKTREKKEALLMVLKYPEIPLHNNCSELGARKVVTKRNISQGTRTEEGTRAQDTFLSLADTTRKLGISFYHYIYDRISKSFEIPALGKLIEEKAVNLRLGILGNFG